MEYMSPNTQTVTGVLGEWNFLWPVCMYQFTMIIVGEIHQFANDVTETHVDVVRGLNVVGTPRCGRIRACEITVVVI